MKRILESDDDENSYDADKKSWMKMIATRWTRNRKTPDYMFEDIIGQEEVKKEKEFFARFGDEINKELG